LEPGGFKLWVKLDSTCTAPPRGLATPVLLSPPELLGDSGRDGV
jgi:hypothetical protein